MLDVDLVHVGMMQMRPYDGRTLNCEYFDESFFPSRIHFSAARHEDQVREFYFSKQTRSRSSDADCRMRSDGAKT